MARAVASPPVARFEVHLVRLDPTQGSEIRKTRPCVVISPDEMNRHLHTVIVAPMTTQGRAYPREFPLYSAARRVRWCWIRFVRSTRRD